MKITLRKVLNLKAISLFRHEKILLSAFLKLSNKQICFEISFINFCSKYLHVHWIKVKETPVIVNLENEVNFCSMKIEKNPGSFFTAVVKLIES